MKKLSLSVFLTSAEKASPEIRHVINPLIQNLRKGLPT